MVKFSGGRISQRRFGDALTERAERAICASGGIHGEEHCCISAGIGREAGGVRRVTRNQAFFSIGGVGW
jgi:hypothetical protein